MAKQIIQFRYYGEGDNNNFPIGLSKAALQTGAAFRGQMPAIQLGIQTLPGTRFYLNGNATRPILIGNTGIYELNLNNLSQITSLSFDSDSLDLIDGQENGKILIDMIYEDGSE